MQPLAEDVAKRAEELKELFLGISLTLVPLLDPARPLLDVMMRHYGHPPSAPIVVQRKDGSKHSARTYEDVLTRCSTLRGPILRDDLLHFAAMHGGTRIGDMIGEGGFRDESNPLLEFARHFRNACAHGNRWHFLGGEPRNPTSLRGRTLDASLHGRRAMPDWLAPGDYLDYLDDIASLFRTRS